MSSDLHRRFRYHTWALECLARTLPTSEAEAARIPLAHTLVADRVWLLRLRGDSTDGVALWPDLDASAIRALARRNAAAYALYLNDLDDVEATIDYTNSKGEAYTSTVSDVLNHVLLHAAHHRGQVNAALRQAGHEPPWVDFIAWIRAGEPDVED